MGMGENGNGGKWKRGKLETGGNGNWGKWKLGKIEMGDNRTGANGNGGKLEWGKMEICHVISSHVISYCAMAINISNAT